MPYIDHSRRARVMPAAPDAATAGELNFQFTMLALRYVRARGLSYQTLNDVLGALEGAKLEFYRRVVAPYEKTKCQENGDVYAEEG